MVNLYSKHLYNLFSILLKYRHTTNRLFEVLQTDVENYVTDEAHFFRASSLIISDWTSPNDDGWEVNFPTGVHVQTSKEEYEFEVKEILSREFCLIYSQSFETLESFLKDCQYEKSRTDQAYRMFLLSIVPKSGQESFSREKMPGGDTLFKAFKRAGGSSYLEFSSKNNKSFNFKLLWTIMSQTRHAIIHSRSVIRRSEIYKSSDHLKIFDDFFRSTELEDDFLRISLEYIDFNNLMKKISEFAFQIFKTMSIQSNLNWEIRE